MEQQIPDHQDTTEKKDKEKRPIRKLIVIGFMIALFAGSMGFLGGFIYISNLDKLRLKELHLINKDGKTNLFLVGDDNPSIEMLDKNNNTRLFLNLGEGGEPILSFFDNTEKRRSSFSLGEGGEPRLTFFDKTFKSRSILSLNEDGDPYLQLWDKQDNLRLTLGSTVLVKKATGTEFKRPTSSIVLFNEKGNVIWKAPIDD